MIYIQSHIIVTKSNYDMHTKLYLSRCLGSFGTYVNSAPIVQSRWCLFRVLGVFVDFDFLSVWSFWLEELLLLHASQEKVNWNLTNVYWAVYWILSRILKYLFPLTYYGRLIPTYGHEDFPTPSKVMASKSSYERCGVCWIEREK